MTALAEVRAAVERLAADATLLALTDEARTALAAGVDPEVRVKIAEALGRWLLDVRAQRQALADVEASIESVLARVMPVQRLEFPGLFLERKGGRDRKEWDHDGLVAALARTFATDPETGEFDETRVPLYADAVRHFRDVAQVSGYRTRTGLVPLGIDPDAYCKTTPGRRTVHVSGEPPVDVREGDES